MVHRPVPWRYHAADANRLLAHAIAAHLVFEFEIFQCLKKTVQMPGARAPLAAFCKISGCTHFHAHGFGHVVTAGEVNVAQFFHQSDALFQRGVGPTGEGGRGLGDRGVGVGLVAQRDHRADFFGCRINDVEVIDGHGIDPLAVDVELAFLDHGVHSLSILATLCPAKSDARK